MDAHGGHDRGSSDEPHREAGGERADMPLAQRSRAGWPRADDDAPELGEDALSGAATPIEGLVRGELGGSLGALALAVLEAGEARIEAGARRA